MTKTDTIHLVMRYSDGFLSDEDTIARHKEILDEQGQVWIGKVGKAFGKRTIGRINTQISNEERTSLFLVRSIKREICDVFRCEIAEASSGAPATLESVPRYYVEDELMRDISTWIRVNDILDFKKADLVDFRIEASKRPILTAIRNSMAAMFIVTERRGIDF